MPHPSFRPAALLLLGLPLPVHAQEAPAAPAPPAGEAAPEAEIVVTAPGARDQTLGNGVPDIRIGKDEIASYGADSIGALLDDLKPQTGNAPIILVNGRKISGPGEIARLPPEAIARVDILPEETALAYGYRADQKVVNVVLERRFAAVTAKAETTIPTAGGRSDHAARVNLLRIAGGKRTSFDLGYSRASALTEAERGLAGEDAAYRTLLPSAERLTAGATFARPLGRGVTAVLNAEAERRWGTSLFGLAGGDSLLAASLLTGTTRAMSLHLGAAINGRLSRWSWSLTSAFDHDASRSVTDRAALPLAGASVTTDRVRSIANGLSSELVANGSLATLPAGRLAATLKAGIAHRSVQSDSQRGAVRTALDTRTDQAQLQANVQLPIASRRDDVLAFLGDLSANINVAHEGISGQGGADSLGFGLSWAPADALRITATISDRGGLPPQAQRDAPRIVTPNVPVYDFVRGETVALERTDGGNPDLVASRSHIVSVTANVKPLAASNLTLNLGYARSRTDDPIGALPAATAAIEAAFPDRFQRGASGELVAIDARPLNFARARSQQLSWGLFWSKGLGPDTDGAAEARGAGDAPDGEAPARARGRLRSGGRLLLSFNHVWRIQNDLLLREGLPLLDLLGGDALGGSGEARHQLSARANLADGGLGVSVGATWASGSRIAGSDSTLRFSELATLDLRMFADLGSQESLAKRLHFLKGARLSLDVDNLFDARQRVRDDLGNTPLGYSPAYLDPLGRSVKLSFRKLF